MKTVFNGAGSDNTSVVKEYLLSTRTPIVHNLFQIGPSRIPRPVGTGQPADLPPWLFMWTDADYPIHSTYLDATYMPQKMKRSQLAYKLGTEASTLTIDLFTNDVQQPLGLTDSPRGLPPYQDAALTLNAATDGASGWEMWYTIKAAAAAGDLDGLTFTMYRVFEQTPGDADTLGVCTMFTGYIGGVTATRSSITLSVVSLMQTLQTKTPTQTIQPGDRGWLYAPRDAFDTSFDVDHGNIAGPRYTLLWVLGGSTAHAFADGWLVYVAGDKFRNTGTGPVYNSFYQRRIRDNAQFSNPFGLGTETAIWLYEPLPFQPLAGDQVFVYEPSAPTSSNKGFPHVPIPETAL